MNRLATLAPRGYVVLVLIATGVIHLIPSTGMVGQDRLSNLYGIPVDGPDLTILLQHRAVLFAVIAGTCFAGAVRRNCTLPAIIVATISVAGFTLLALAQPPTTDEIQTVATTDNILTIALLAALATEILTRRRAANNHDKREGAANRRHN